MEDELITYNIRDYMDERQKSVFTYTGETVILNFSRKEVPAKDDSLKNDSNNDEEHDFENDGFGDNLEIGDDGLRETLGF